MLTSSYIFSTLTRKRREEVMKLRKPDELNSVWLDKMECILTNAIAMCMYDHKMTLECLDKSYKHMCDYYRKNASVPKDDG